NPVRTCKGKGTGTNPCYRYRRVEKTPKWPGQWLTVGARPETSCRHPGNHDATGLLASLATTMAADDSERGHIQNRYRRPCRAFEYPLLRPQSPAQGIDLLFARGHRR